MGKKQKNSKTHLRFNPNWVNKYTVVLSLFLIWITFIDGNSLITLYHLKKQVKELESEKISYQEKLSNAIVAKQNLEKNQEKFARETYYLHKSNEEVLIIERKKK